MGGGLITLLFMKTPAKTPSAGAKSLGGFLSRLGLSRSEFERSYVAPAQDISQSDLYLYGAGITSAATLLGQGRKAARSRQIIYEKWMRMEGDPIVSTAIQLLVTAALGGHETTGELVFVEENPKTAGDKKLKPIVDDVATLAPLFNQIAFSSAYTGAVYGDAYARVYSRPKEGVLGLCTNELVRPQLVQPFERGERTVGYALMLGEKNFERLDITQMARLKMPRQQWIPQFGVVEKALKIAITEDDIDALPIMPSMVGGSLLFNAEEAYDNLSASLLGLVGQRWIDSIDEQIVTINLESTNKEQQKRLVDSMKRLLSQSKYYAEQAVKRGYPMMERIRYLIPVFNEKQLSTVQPANGGSSGRAGSISIDDIMLHARLLAGALGVDLSMIGFADQLAGGLGEGGFFRVSAQAAERARVIRVALEEFFNQIIDIHTLQKYGIVFKPGERPWDISFYGSISALEAEKQRTRNDAMQAGLVLAQAMQGLKDMGATKDIMENFLEKTMMLDEPQAKLYAKIVEQAGNGEEGGGDFGGGNGGGFGPQQNAVPEEDEPEAQAKPKPPIKLKKSEEETSSEEV